MLAKGWRRQYFIDHCSYDISRSLNCVIQQKLQGSREARVKSITTKFLDSRKLQTSRFSLYCEDKGDCVLLQYTSDIFFDRAVSKCQEISSEARDFFFCSCRGFCFWATYLYLEGKTTRNSKSLWISSSSFLFLCINFESFHLAFLVVFHFSASRPRSIAQVFFFSVALYLQVIY